MSSVHSRCLGAGSISLLHSGTLSSQQRMATGTVAMQCPVTTGHPGPSLGRVQLTVAFQRLCTSAPAAPLLSSGLARGNSEKPALEAYLQDTKHGSVSPGPRSRRSPSPARCRQQEEVELAARIPPRHRAAREGPCAAQFISELTQAKRNSFAFMLRGSWRDPWCPELKGFVVYQRFLHHNTRSP